MSDTIYTIGKLVYFVLSMAMGFVLAKVGFNATANWEFWVIYSIFHIGCLSCIATGYAACKSGLLKKS